VLLAAAPSCYALPPVSEGYTVKSLSIIALLLALALGGLWWMHGQHLATLTEKAVTTTTIDDFGDEVEQVHWEKALEIGLDVAVPGIVGLLLVGLSSTLLGTRRRRLARGSLLLGGAALVGAIASLVIAYTG